VQRAVARGEISAEQVQAYQARRAPAHRGAGRPRR